MTILLVVLILTVNHVHRQSAMSDYKMTCPIFMNTKPQLINVTQLSVRGKEGGMSGYTERERTKGNRVNEYSVELIQNSQNRMTEKDSTEFLNIFD